MKVYIIDNYDSFTYNLYQYIGEILTSEQKQGAIKNFEIIVKRNDEVTLEDVEAAKPDRIIISPGPGSPDDKAYFGVCADVIKTLGQTTPLLGVCLGMQGIVHAFGGDIIKATLPMHGKISPITHRGETLFKDEPNYIEIMRYHSLMAKVETLPACLKITAVVGKYNLEEFNALNTENTPEIMAVEHRQYPIYGIQFHPESFGTEGGKDIIRNFLLQSS